jgi:hypothetical protein
LHRDRPWLTLSACGPSERRPSILREGTTSYNRYNGLRTPRLYPYEAERASRRREEQRHRPEECSPTPTRAAPLADHRPHARTGPRFMANRISVTRKVEPSTDGATRDN